MPNLTDRQRLELALPVSLFYVLTGAPDAFKAASPELAARAASDIETLREDLRTAWLEPFADLVPTKRQALFRRLERLNRVVVATWHEYTALEVMLVILCFLQDLTDREYLILWEGSAMDRAMKRLMPMCRHGLGDPAVEIPAQERAVMLLDLLQAEGLYR